jgi:hypothetical protein
MHCWISSTQGEPCNSGRGTDRARLGDGETQKLRLQDEENFRRDVCVGWWKTVAHLSGDTKSK